MSTPSRFIILTLVLPWSILLLHAYYYYPFLADDALISLRYSQRLLEGHGLTWTDGIPVEGYSNLLWILLCAGLGGLKIDLIDSARLLGITGMSLVLFANAYLYRHLFPQRGFLPLIVGQLFLVFTAPVAVWTIGGLEQPLVAVLLAWSIVFMVLILQPSPPRPAWIWSLSILLGLLAITRPDGMLFTVTMLMALFLLRGLNQASIWTAAKILTWPVLCYGSQLAFRLWYYQAWIPNTALVKLSPSLKHFLIGSQYLLTGLTSLLPFSLISLAVLVIFLFKRNKLHQELIIPLLLITLVWSIYVAMISGDIFPAFRHGLPLIIVFTYLTTYAIARWWYLLNTQTAKILFGVMLILSGGYYTINQFQSKRNRAALTERWEWHGQVIGQLLHTAFGQQQPLLAVDSSGCLPYWSKLPALDMLGLNDYYLPRHLPPNFGQSWIGHEVGNGEYVLAQQPDLVIFCLPTGSFVACFRSGQEMQQNPNFFTWYTPVQFKGQLPYEVSSVIWVKRDSAKIGIRSLPDQTIIPAYLFNDNPHTVATLDQQSQLAITLLKDEPAQIKNLTLSSMPTQVEVIPASKSVLTTVNKEADGTVSVQLRNTSSVSVTVNEVRLYFR